MDQKLNPAEFKGFIINETAAMDFATPNIVNMNKSCNTLTIETTLQDADTVNRNSRMYEKDALDFGLNTPYILERLKTKTWYGESGRRLPFTAVM